MNVFITGATSGIGLAAANVFAQKAMTSFSQGEMK